MAFNDITNAIETKAADAFGAVTDKFREHGEKIGLVKKKDPAKPTDVDMFSLSHFVASVRADGWRMSRGYYYIVRIYGQNMSGEALAFNCNKVTLPGWKAKTQEGKIYGVSYEIATSLEQDPIWLTFNVDIRHVIEEYFMNTAKIRCFDGGEFGDDGSFSPKYKNKYQFNMEVIVTDENFVPVHEYMFNNAMFKTVQNISYGHANTNFTEVTVEVVYETSKVIQVMTERSKSLPNPNVKNKNQIKLGPFTADVSAVNQVLDTTGKIPDWFSGPEKL